MTSANPIGDTGEHYVYCIKSIFQFRIPVSYFVKVRKLRDSVKVSKSVCMLHFQNCSMNFDKIIYLWCTASFQAGLILFVQVF